jgi:hypothetical protein
MGGDSDYKMIRDGVGVRLVVREGEGKGRGESNGKFR